ncbi:hypothetical protein NKH77_44210 [Streptomyces sp. M19]
MRAANDRSCGRGGWGSEHRFPCPDDDASLGIAAILAKVSDAQATATAREALRAAAGVAGRDDVPADVHQTIVWLRLALAGQILVAETNRRMLTTAPPIAAALRGTT